MDTDVMKYINIISNITLIDNDFLILSYKKYEGFVMSGLQCVRIQCDENKQTSDILGQYYFRLKPDK